MREQLGKYILRRKLNLVVMVSVSPIVESLTVDEERKRRNKSETRF